jgi:hypothetical protein
MGGGMTEWISLVVPWLFVTNGLLFAVLSVWFLWERRPEASCSFGPPSVLHWVL